MRDAETKLAVIRERGMKGLPLERVYRQLYNPDLYLRGYGRIYRNDGAMTRGATSETIDGMSMQKIEGIIELVRQERYRWTPARRINIPKTNGKTRPLGIPTWSDKLVQEAMRSILDAYYEPQFSPNSHGFRPDRGCHTALKDIFHGWTGTKWFIEGDIKGCFDNIDHTILLSILREKIHDGRFITLVESLLKAGYLEEWSYRATLSGTPQGGVISPILANIYLDKLDQFVEQTLIPRYTKSKQRRMTREYERIMGQITRLRKKGATRETLLPLLKERQTMIPANPFDPAYRRLRYIRYADDFVLGFAGPKDEAEAIRSQIGDFLRDHLKLELSPEKTLITHAGTGMAKFLGHEISTGTPRHGSHRGAIRLHIPANKLEDKIARYMRDGKAIHRPELLNESDYEIISKYGSEYRGLVQFYSYAVNLNWMHKLHWFMRRSLLKTLAAKHKTSTKKMYLAYRSEAYDRGRKLRCIEVQVPRPGKEPLIARFGGLQLRTNPFLKTIFDLPEGLDRLPGKRTELLERLLAETCDLCGSTDRIEVHHIRKLADLKVSGQRAKPSWIQSMASRQRKTLIVCQPCHNAIHAGRPTRKPIGQEPANDE